MSIGNEEYGASLDLQQLCSFRMKFRFVGRPDITRAWLRAHPRRSSSSSADLLESAGFRPPQL